MKKRVSAAFPIGSFRGWVLRGYLRNPVRFSIALIRSFAATYKITGKVFPVCIRVQPGQVFTTAVGNGARVRIDGVVSVAEWGGCQLPSSLNLGENAVLSIYGDFEIGPNVHISANANAELVLGGKKDSTASGVTCNSRIMVAKSVHIGSDTIIAWDVLITDSDWHQIEGVKMEAEVVIGDHVWIAHGASILKGSFVPENSIVAAKSLVQGAFKGSGLLLAGTPARIVREGVKWKR